MNSSKQTVGELLANLFWWVVALTGLSFEWGFFSRLGELMANHVWELR